MKKTYRIKTNNQELLIRKQNESDATSRWFRKKKAQVNNLEVGNNGKSGNNGKEKMKEMKGKKIKEEESKGCLFIL